MDGTGKAVLRALLVVAGVLMQPAPGRGEIVGRADVLDGDTLDIGYVRIRLHGIDAPELGQRCARAGGKSWDCGTEAMNRLAALVGAGPINCLGMSRDAYGRIIGSCIADGQDIAGQLIAEGLAWAFVEYSDDYVAREAVARQAEVGIWQAPTQTAWEFRADRWARAAAVAPRENCPIKGNINRDGERIYHTPWSRYYGRTKINEDDGEVWFCDEAEAEAAGWRPAAGR